MTFLPAERSHVQTSSSREKTNPLTLCLTPDALLRLTVATSGELKSQKGKLFFFPTRSSRGGAAAGGRVTQGSFSEVCHSSHHHFTPPYTPLSASLSPPMCHKGAARPCRNEEESPHILAITWPRRVEESIRGVPSLTPHKAELPRQMCFWKLP